MRLITKFSISLLAVTTVTACSDDPKKVVKPLVDAPPVVDIDAPSTDLCTAPMVDRAVPSVLAPGGLHFADADGIMSPAVDARYIVVGDLDAAMMDNLNLNFFEPDAPFSPTVAAAAGKTFDVGELTPDMTMLVNPGIFGLIFPDGVQTTMDPKGVYLLLEGTVKIDAIGADLLTVTGTNLGFLHVIRNGAKFEVAADECDTIVASLSYAGDPTERTLKPGATSRPALSASELKVIETFRLDYLRNKHK